jgi:two-component system sensor histidine kinase DesK
VIRHARARRCEVVLRQDSSGLRLVVTDDGIGGEHEEGAGLSGMRTRLAAIGGTVERDGRRGTRLTLAVPDRQPALSRELAAS